MILIDHWLNRITMYRLVRYFLATIWSAGLISSALGLIGVRPLDLILSLVIILTSCLAVNWLLSKLYKAPANTDSTLITALILALIVGPEHSIAGLLILALVGAIAIASKYVLAINRKHLFNPAAFSIVVSSLVFGYYPSWWVGNIYLVFLVLTAGFLIVRKIQRSDLALSFVATYLITSLGPSLFSLQHLNFALQELLNASPVPFFALVMLTEPSTTPPTRQLRIWYGVLVALLFVPFVRLGTFTFSLEMALITANIFSFLVGFKRRVLMSLKEKILVASNVYDFAFTPDQPLQFRPGQYLEWTLQHKKQDQRGMRRYFTIASSPTEREVHLGVKFYQKPSSYKKAFRDLQPGDTMIASQLAGEFILPNNQKQKLVFIAGGIGVTPFRSMVKYLIDTNQRRDIVLFYAARSYADLAYRELFEEARTKLGIETLYILQDTNGIPNTNHYISGVVTEKLLRERVSDYVDRVYYISGSKSMIDAFRKTLLQMKIPRRRIKTDFFPGYV